MKQSIILLLLFSSYLNAGSLYQCKQANGNVSFQDRPCEGETLKVSELKSNAPTIKEKDMITVLAKLSGKSESSLRSDPKAKAAAEALIAIDAAKSYAYTRMFYPEAKYCTNGVGAAMSQYKSKAANIIALGKHYYTVGFDFRLGSEQVKKSGQELTNALESEVSKRERSLVNASSSVKGRRCSQAKSALELYAKVYSG